MNDRGALLAFRRSIDGLAVADDSDCLQRFSRDESHWPGQAPAMVVFAKTAADVQRVFRAANAHTVSVTPVGARTGKSGASIPGVGSVALSLEHMNRLHPVDVVNMTVSAEPGVLTGEVMAAAEASGLFYPPGPNSWRSCTIGGNVACNAGGPKAVKYGVTRDYVLQMQWVLPSGELIRVGRKTPKGVAGYDLCSLLVGSEGTLGVATEIVLQLVPKPKAVATALLSFTALEAAIEAGAAARRLGLEPRALELFDEVAVQAVAPALAAIGLHRNACAALIIELDGPSESALLEGLASFIETVHPLDSAVAANASQADSIWAVRASLSPALRRLKGLKISEDVVLPFSALFEAVGQFKANGQALGLTVATYGHLGDGNLHTNVLFETESQRGLAEQFVAQMMQSVIEFGGTISGEHGIGLSKRAFLESELGPVSVQLQRALKGLFDPNRICNPGKIF